MLALSFPQMDGLTMVPLIAASPRSAITTNSLSTIIRVTQIDARSTTISASNVPVTRNLSAVVSRKAPRTVVIPQRLAKYPSRKSVSAATKNSTAA